MARAAERGFTLIELMTVMAILTILFSIALPQYRTSIVHAREAVLREDLFTLRDLVDQYASDKGVYPPSLDVLVEEGYLRELPVDPMTQAADWETIFEQPDPDNPSAAVGVYDVRSASSLVGLNGRPYNEW